MITNSLVSRKPRALHRAAPGSTSWDVHSSSGRTAPGALNACSPSCKKPCGLRGPQAKEAGWLTSLAELQVDLLPRAVTTRTDELAPRGTWLQKLLLTLVVAYVAVRIVDCCVRWF